MSVEREIAGVCRVRKRLFREKESKRICMSISITIEIVCVSIEREKSVYKETERERVCVER